MEIFGERVEPNSSFERDIGASIVVQVGFGWYALGTNAPNGIGWEFFMRQTHIEAIYLPSERNKPPAFENVLYREKYFLYKDVQATF